MSHADLEYGKGLSRFNVPTDRRLGVRAPDLRRIAKEIGTDHALALELWNNSWRDARAIAFLIADPAKVTEEMMEEWISQVDNWGDCDGVCGCLFDRTPFARRKAIEWIDREEEFVKRAGFVLMASLAVHDKAALDEVFLNFLPLIEAHSSDGRNFVKKAVNWALRNIGKRNRALNKAAVTTAERILARGDSCARWIARDALRELRSKQVQNRLQKKKDKR
jgi:3-methyladenine DNA glycosylase AlkD